MMGPERKVEQYLFKQVRSAGGFCIKLAPTVAGIPDRLVVLPEGRFFLVELKSETGQLRPIQREWHYRLHLIGVTVIVLRTKEEVDQWLTTI